MAIKNKDGSTFKLSAPNPAMRKQDLWCDGSKLVLHNFKYEDVILHNSDHEEKKPEPVKKKYKPLDEIVPQEINVLIKETVVPPEDKARKKKPPTKNINILYCLPAITTDNFDPLYNENRISVTYGTQFIFEAIVTGSTDLTLEMWTTKDLTKNSIVYQPHTRRWWKVESTIAHSDGFTVGCSPSAIQPSFRLQP